MAQTYVCYKTHICHNIMYSEYRENVALNMEGVRFLTN